MTGHYEMLLKYLRVLITIQSGKGELVCHLANTYVDGDGIGVWSSFDAAITPLTPVSPASSRFADDEHQRVFVQECNSLLRSFFTCS